MTSPCAKHCEKGGPEPMPEASVEASEEGHGSGEGWMAQTKSTEGEFTLGNPIGHKP